MLPERVYDLFALWEKAQEDGTPFSLDDHNVTPEEREAFARLMAELSPVPNPANRDETPQLPPPTGRYRFVKFIARGGMGEVYQGEDTLLRRTVALKVLQRRLGVSAGKFREEALLVAKLSHPGIVPVYDFGELPDGRPFFAMKLVEGRTLEDVLGDSDASSPNLPRWLQYFEQVCQTVAYAHSQNPPLLHRDLKPSNVMIGAYGEVQVMDWGIARVVSEVSSKGEQVEFLGSEGPDLDSGATTVDEVSNDGGNVMRGETATGVAKGTVAYMAPEQARGERENIGPQSDVFALGGIVCRMLTGRPTFVSDAYEGIFSKAARGDIAEASERLDQSGADPDLIGLAKRCLNPSIAGRPMSAKEVAEATVSYRAGVEARLQRAQTERAEAVVRAAEQRRRRQQLAVASSVIVLVLLTGLGVSYWQIRRAVAAEQSATNERNEKGAALQAELDASNQALAALKSLVDGPIETKFAEAQALSEADRQFLKGVIAQFEAFAKVRRDDVEGREAQGYGAFAVARIYQILGDFAQAEEGYKRALDAYQRLARDFPNRVEFTRRLAAAYGNRGVLRQQHHDFQTAEADFASALALQTQLVAAYGTTNDRASLAASHINLANYFSHTNRAAEAVSHLDAALAIQERLVTEFPAEHAYKINVAKALHNKSTLQRLTNRFGNPQTTGDTAISILERLAGANPDDPEIIGLLANGLAERALRAESTHKYEEAKHDSIRATSYYRKIAQKYPNRLDFQLHWAQCREVFARILGYADGLKAAVAEFDGVINMLQTLTTEYPEQPEIQEYLAKTTNSYGFLLQRAGHLEAAAEQFDRAVGLLKVLCGKFPTSVLLRTQLAMAYGNRGALRRSLKKYTDAIADYDAAQRLFQAMAGKNPGDLDSLGKLADLQYNRGVLEMHLEQYTQAKSSFDEALQVFERLPAASGRGNPDLPRQFGNALVNRGIVLAHLSRLSEAETDFTKAIEYRGQLMKDYPAIAEFRCDVASALVGRAQVYVALRRMDEARADYDVALDLERRITIDFPAVVSHRLNLIRSHLDRGEMMRTTSAYLEAMSDFDAAVWLARQLVSDYREDKEARMTMAKCFFARGGCLSKRSMVNEALEDFDAAVEACKALTAQYQSDMEYRAELGRCHFARDSFKTSVGRGG